MDQVTLQRFEQSDQGTLGAWYVNDARFCWTLELPDRQNMPNVSRIPPGHYLCSWGHSPRFGQVYTIDAVPGRSLIRIHHGNLAGDSEKGYRTHSHGCIILGARRGWLNRQRAVLVSRPTRSKFERALNGRPFGLRILEAQ